MVSKPHVVLAMAGLLALICMLIYGIASAGDPPPPIKEPRLRAPFLIVTVSCDEMTLSLLCERDEDQCTHRSAGRCFRCREFLGTQEVPEVAREHGDAFARMADDGRFWKSPPAEQMLAPYAQFIVGSMLNEEVRRIRALHAEERICESRIETDPEHFPVEGRPL